jgi:hypothetical protein
MYYLLLQKPHGTNMKVKVLPELRRLHDRDTIICVYQFHYEQSCDIHQLEHQENDCQAIHSK